MTHKIIQKYGTGDAVPIDAKYLCTQVETRVCRQQDSAQMETEITDNMYVWHYFEVPVKEDPRYPTSGAV